MTANNPKLQTLQRLRELNEKRNTADHNHFEFIAFMLENADWLLTCVEALAWYADEENWAWLGDGMTDPAVDLDGGERARQALGGGE